MRRLALLAVLFCLCQTGAISVFAEDKSPGFKRFKTQNAGGRRGVYFLPENYRNKSLPIMLLLHGSSINGRAVANLFKKQAIRKKFIIIAPDSVNEFGWEIETGDGPETGDQIHISRCIEEVFGLSSVKLNSAKFLVAGISAGGAVAGFLGSNNSRFKAIADMHGGIYLESLGSNTVPVRLSTGTLDTLRPPQELRSYLDGLPNYSFSNVTYNEYNVGHEVPLEERNDLVNWWLSLK